MRSVALSILPAIVSLCAAAQPAKLEGSKFTIEATGGGRATPFSLVTIPGTSESPTLVAEEKDTGLVIPLQKDRTGLVGILPVNTAAGSHTFIIKPGQGIGSAPIELKLLARPDSKTSAIEVYDSGDLFTTFHWGEEYRKPFLSPLLGEGGSPLTRAFPLPADGKTKDHPHHVSFWSAHGDVNGGDFWQYSEQAGWQWVDSVQHGSGPVFASIASQDVWKDKDLKPVIDEARSYIFYDTPANARLIDVRVTFTATYGDVKFGDTKEGGIVGFRMNDDLREQGGTGKITTSEGAVGEKAAWGKPAAWCDYSGTLEGFGARGIAVMDHPSSFRYPVHWHVRAYGLMAANPFGYSDFTGGKENGDHTLPKGESVAFSYRIYLHSGDAAAADVAGYYQDFVHPPVVKWVE